MLCRLDIRDFVLVEHLELDFDRGFTALTGETGAGKSILVDALSVALGERSDAGLVREGCVKAEVSAEFLVAGNVSVARFLTENELEGDDQCLLRRLIDSSGRSRAWINGTPVTVQQLRTLGDLLVDIHGQHEHQSLSKPVTQRALLDAYADAQELSNQTAEAWSAWQEAKRRSASARTDSESVRREREQLEWQINELEALGFRADEWASISEEHTRLAHSASLVEAAAYAMQMLADDDSAVLSAVSSVHSRLAAELEFDPRLQELLDTIENARIQIQETVYGLRRYQQYLEIDPRRLNEVNTRIDAIHTVARKYRTSPASLPELLENARRRLDELVSTMDVEELERREALAREACLKIAGKLSAKRSKVAGALSQKVTEAMQTLAMQGGVFEVALSDLEECASYGLEQVEFRVAGHAGTSPRALSKVASGGELSRISLAIQTVATEIAHASTLIFDEVDVGIGGGVAHVVGRMLGKLGDHHQVMCVTHLPQVAACANQQLKVSKQMRNGAAASVVRRLETEERVEEIARMLGGTSITDTTRKHAQEMLGAA